MYILGQTGEILVNAEHVECFYEQPERGLPAIKARTRSVNVTLGIYKGKEAIDKAMASLGMALMAGDKNGLHVYAMLADDTPQNIEQTPAADPDPKEGGKHGEVESNVPAAGGA